MNLEEQREQENRENRKKRRKKEQMQAFAVLAGAVVVVALIVLLLITGVNALLKAGSKGKNKAVKETSQESVQNTENELQSGDADTAEVQQETDTEESSPQEPDAQDASGVGEDTAEEEPSEELSEEEIEEQKQQILDSYVQNILDMMEVEEKVATMFLVTPQNITGVQRAKQAGSTTSAALNTYAVGGILYDETNMEDKDQFTLMIANTRNFSKYELLIAVNDEGGASSPFSLSGIREEELPGQAEIATSGSVSDAYRNGINKSSLFRTLGVNLNLAPVTDVATNPRSSIAGRSYGDNVESVVSLVKSEVKGLADQGIDSCVKYFPGVGDVTGDTKSARVTSQRTKEDLEANECVIYKELIEEGIPMIMVSHVSMPNIIGDNTPASLSSVIMTDILRNELGFDGVIITDYMNKGAVTKYYKHAAAPVMAVQAGADMIAVPADFKKAYQGLLDAVQSGEITEERINESVKRILCMKYKNIVEYESYGFVGAQSMEAGDATGTAEDTFIE
ncbi:MAG: glycoside hydrolase family 3 protein [Lachnospiraceae bacterium]|nr:glycoside hydrolase family 3 protein [Lachnospiraceae bacterium]